MTVHRVLTDICRDELKRTVLAHDDLIAAGLGINKALRIIHRFWRETGIELNVNSFYLWRSTNALGHALDTGAYASLPKIIELKGGEAEQTVIVFAGGLSCFLEIRDLIGHLPFPGRVIGMALTRFRFPPQKPALVKDEIDTCLQALHRTGMRGPYRLLGYSFGGVFALELARALRNRGDDVGFLGLIDTPLGEQNWPMSIWLPFMLKRLRRRLNAIPSPKQREAGLLDSEVAAPGHAQLMKRQGAGLSEQLRPFLFRFLNPLRPDYPTKAPQWAGNYPPAYDDMARQFIRMKGLYKPSPYHGPLTFYRALGGSPVDCDPRRLWQPYLPQAEWIDMRGNHQSIVIGRHAEALARDIDRRLTL